jgi:Tfp pilus assembly protein PilO
MEQDLLHLIEFDNFNAYEGYLYAKKLKETRNERRKIKNELEPMKIMIDNIRPLKEKFKQTYEKVDIADKRLHNSKYHPRVLKNLFKETKRLEVVS